MPEQIGLVANLLFLLALYLFIWAVARNSFKFVFGNKKPANKTAEKPVSEVKSISSHQPVLKDLNSGDIYRLDNDILLVGRSPNCHIKIFDGYTSQHHATIKKIGFAWLLEDEESTNGTFINGKRLRKKTYLNYGDRIIFGRAEFIFEEG